VADERAAGVGLRIGARAAMTMAMNGNGNRKGNVRRRRVVVVGSLNVDWIARVARLPRAGETVLGTALTERFGGKGANQAVAAARQGARVSLIGRVGADDLGRRYRAHLRREGIDATAVRETARTPTGVALIAVDIHAENSIIVVPGANGSLSPADVRAHGDRIAAAHALLVQWEVPQATVLETLRLAHRAGVPAIVNPSPMREGFPWRRNPIHTLIVNADEARALFGVKTRALSGGGNRGLRSWRALLESHGVERLIITRGADPTLGFSRDESLIVQTLPLTPRDTVGAGDAFAGAYAACVANGRPFRESIRYANAAGGLATLASGAQEAAPHRRAVERALLRAQALARTV
jgi:ribokinase